MPLLYEEHTFELDDAYNSIDGYHCYSSSRNGPVNAKDVRCDDDAGTVDLCGGGVAAVVAVLWTSVVECFEFCRRWRGTWS